jgi:hypothetical protein
MNYPPSYNDLMDKALNYLKESHPEDYNGMSIQRRNKYAESAAKRAEGCAKTEIEATDFDFSALSKIW